MWYNLLMAYSIDFRKKVLSYCERTGSITEASHVFQLPSTMRSKLWATLEKKNHTYYEQDPEKVAIFLKNFNRLKHLAPV
ncbi:IS630 transposase-related protein [Streptococcus pneumoniae]|uniref:IS630 transposase-related protein n=1 Tax=Streptococcus pneumoniae TaxID=1313 RepID=UPI0039E58B1D